MTWRELLAENRIERHKTSKQELDDLRSAVERNLQDAAVAQLSADNRFGLAYEGALLLAKMDTGMEFTIDLSPDAQAQLDAFTARERRTLLDAVDVQPAMPTK